MSTNVRNTKINGIDAKLWDHSDSSPPRRIAAHFDRDDDRIREVGTSVRHDAVVWLSEDTPIGFTPPEGWRISKTFVGSNGGVAVNLVRDEGEA